MSTPRIHLAPESAPPASGGRELRVAPRIACQIPVAASIDGEEFSSAISDISASGLALALARPVVLGEVFRLSFQLPDRDASEVDCAGLVRSCRQVGEQSLVGMELHNLAPGSRSSIASYIHATLERAVLGEQRPRWASSSDLGTARVFDSGEQDRPVLRWTPGLPALFDQVAAAISELETVFVPTLSSGLTEGQQVYLEVIPPLSHAIFRMLGEVVWVEHGAPQASLDGVGLRLGGLSAMDRHLLASIQSYYETEAARYR